MKLPADVIIHYEENKSGTGIEEIVLGELIHCKDCIHFKSFVENDGMWCDMLEIDLGENGFCSYGERKRRMITHVIVELDFPIEEKYWDDDMSNNEYYGIGKPLIRCRNCRHRLKNHTCLRTMKRKPDDGYCDEGEIDEGSVLAKYMAV